MRECTVASIVIGKNTIRNSRVSAFHLLTSYEPVVVLSIYCQIQLLIEKLQEGQQIGWILNVGMLY